MSEEKSKLKIPEILKNTPAVKSVELTVTPATRPFTKEELYAQSICSHDAPGQQLGSPCIRCKKLL